MFIKYNRPNNHVMSTFGGQLGGVMQMPDTHILRPGWNEFPDHVFKLHENDPEIKKFIKDGVIELSAVKVSEKVGKKTVTHVIGANNSEVHLADVKDEKEAISIIEGTFNREMLQRWDDEETRSKVKRALAKQFKVLRNEPEEESA